MSDLNVVKNKNTIFLYVISKSHLRYIDIIEKIYKDAEIIILYEKIPNIILETEKITKKYKFINIKIISETKNIFYQKPVIFFFATAQLQKNLIKIINYSLINNIPTIGIQEGNQILLQNNRINNYILPLNYFLLTSNYEKTGFISLGYNEKRLKVIGWINNQKKHGSILKKKNKVALLTLLAPKILNHNSIEDDDFRKKIFKLISIGLPDDYHLYIKPYPAENKINIENFIKKNVSYTNLTIVDKDENINELLQNCDLLLNTGYSQVIFEAISINKPFLIINTPDNEKSQMENKYKEICVNNSEALNNKVKNLDDLDCYYRKIKKTHYPFDNQQTYLNLTNLIHSLKFNNNNDELIREQIIWNLFMNQTDELKELLSKIINKKNTIDESLIAITNKNAKENDYQNILNLFKEKIIENAIMALYINFIIKNNIFPSKNLIKIIDNFPPKYLCYSMITDSLKWKSYLLKNKKYTAYRNYSAILNPKISEILKSFIFKKRFFYFLQFFPPFIYLSFYNSIFIKLLNKFIKKNLD